MPVNYTTTENAAICSYHNIPKLLTKLKMAALDIKVYINTNDTQITYSPPLNYWNYSQLPFLQTLPFPGGLVP